jgi:hypothetical protein
MNVPGHQYVCNKVPLIYLQDKLKLFFSNENMILLEERHK